MPIWILRRGQPATMLAPSHAPATAMMIIRTRVLASTSTPRMKMNAWTIVGSACPIVIVPGIRSSGTIFFSL